MRWIETLSEGKISINHNNKTVLQLSAPDDTNYYSFSFSGNSAFRDVILDQALAISVS